MEKLNMSINKILLVDDTPVHLDALKAAVADIGAKVTAVTTGEEAVSKAKSEKPDIILMDIVMDGLDGYGACREIVQDEETKDIPVIFVSTKNQRADRMWAEKQGARNLITKPFTTEQIVEEINKYQ